MQTAGNMEKVLHKRRPKYTREQIYDNIELYLIMLPVLILIFMMCYLPLYGLLIAFQDYTPGMAIFSLTENIRWVGLKHFVNFINGKYFVRLITNTILLSLYNLIWILGSNCICIIAE